MSYDFEKTHALILESAKAHFLEEGFRGASIRQICRDAGVTNGAFYAHFESKEDLFGCLVGAAMQGLEELFNAERSGYMDVHCEEDILTALQRTFTSDETVIHYVYEHADAFRLLLTAGGGTVYEDFRGKLMEYERSGSMAFFDLCRPYVRRPENISENIVEQASAMIVSTVCDCFLGGKTEAENVRETRLASEFCLAGLRRIWGI